MKRIRLILFLGMLLVFSQSQAQIKLHIDTVAGQAPPASAIFGDSFQFLALIRNDSLNTYKGSLSYFYRIDTSTYTSSDNVSGIQYSALNDTIPGGDTIFRFFTVHVTGPKFKAGPSVVVIWPVANGTYAGDSLRFSIFAQDTSTVGIPGEEPDDLRLAVLGNQLIFLSSSEIGLRHVRIYDLQGKLALQKENPEKYMDLGAIPTGAYVAEVIDATKRRRVFRFVK